MRLQSRIPLQFQIPTTSHAGEHAVWLAVCAAIGGDQNFLIWPNQETMDAICRTPPPHPPSLDLHRTLFSPPFCLYTKIYCRLFSRGIFRFFIVIMRTLLS